MTEIHIGSKGTNTIIPAGYKNRAARRRMKKLNLHHVHRVLPEYCHDHKITSRPSEDRESQKSA